MEIIALFHDTDRKGKLLFYKVSSAVLDGLLNMFEQDENRGKTSKRNLGKSLSSNRNNTSSGDENRKNLSSTLI